jgi:hypothetical protein
LVEVEFKEVRFVGASRFEDGAEEEEVVKSETDARTRNEDEAAIEEIAVGAGQDVEVEGEFLEDGEVVIANGHVGGELREGEIFGLGD